MKIHALYQAPLRKADPEESLADAADRMSFFEVGALAVFDGAEMVGIITERDVIHAVSLGEVLATTMVADYMTKHPASIGLGDDTTKAAEAMVALGTRHLPVVDRGEVVGMISARDLLLAETMASVAGT